MNSKKYQLTFWAQVIIIYIICISAILNLSLNFGNKNERLWITLLSSSIGYLLPNPSLSKPKTKSKVQGLFDSVSGTSLAKTSLVSANSPELSLGVKDDQQQP